MPVTNNLVSVNVIVETIAGKYLQAGMHWAFGIVKLLNSHCIS